MEQHHNTLVEYLKKFEEQFDVELDATGYETTAEENGGIYEEEHWVKDLINSPADRLNFKVGGWFSMDTRGDGNPAVYCLLAVEVNNEKLEETKALKCRYHHDKEKWGELRWESF